MLTNQNYARIPAYGSTVINTTNTAKDGTGFINNLFVAGGDGSFIDEIAIVSLNTTNNQAGVFRIFINDGTSIKLFQEVTVDSISAGSTLVGFTAKISDMQLILPTGHSLGCTCTTASSTYTYAVHTVSAGHF